MDGYLWLKETLQRRGGSGELGFLDFSPSAFWQVQLQA
jgi:hypothetical protein